MFYFELKTLIIFFSRQYAFLCDCEEWKNLMCMNKTNINSFNYPAKNKQSFVVVSYGKS